MKEPRQRGARRERYVALALLGATIAAGVGLGRWLDPTRRRAIAASAAPFAFPDFAFADQAGAVVSRRALLGRSWLATVALPSCDDAADELGERLAAIRSRTGPDTPLVTFWVAPGDDWRAMAARGAPAGDA
ncbi:MAG TPA: hypothetical protein VHL80_01215, partial [Polyangia bacterium]|nr:hypothetical protein [Polyangia bacterium]